MVISTFSGRNNDRDAACSSFPRVVADATASPAIDSIERGIEQFDPAGSPDRSRVRGLVRSLWTTPDNASISRSIWIPYGSGDVRMPERAFSVGPFL